MPKFVIRALLAIIIGAAAGTLLVPADAQATSLLQQSQTPSEPTVAPTVVTKTPLKLEAVSANGVCGTTLDGKNQYLCIGETNAITANDTVSKLKSFFVGAGQLCGIDERGVRCWGTTGRFAKPIREILASATPATVRFGRDSVCVSQTDKTVVCYFAETQVWNPTGNMSTVIPAPKIFGPYKDLRDFQVSEDAFCVLDGDAVSCESVRTTQNTTNPTGANLPNLPVAFKGARSISIAWDSVCVLHDGGLDCARGRGGVDLRNYHVDGPWLKAKRLYQSGYDGVCASDENEKPLCVKIGLLAGEVTDSAPPELFKSGIEVLKFKSNGDSRCAIVNTATEKRALYCGYFGTMTKVAIAAADVVDFEMSMESVCALNQAGIVSCFYATSHLPSPLPEDGSVSKTAGRCRWNDSRLHCASIDFEIDLSDIHKIIGVSQDSSDVGELPCFVYEDAGGIRNLKCLGVAASLLGDTPTLNTDITQVAVTYQHACGYGGDGVTCWGEPLGGVVTPNLSRVTKLQFGQDFACATDQFGLICWGRDLDTRGLEVPAALTDASSVLDFAVGSNHICAVTRAKTLQCWGTDQQQLTPPDLHDVTSVLISENTSCASSSEGVTCWGPRFGALQTQPSVRAPLNSNLNGSPR